MSSQGPGWWQASDGRWYPPEQHPDAVAAQGGPTTSPTPPAGPPPTWTPPDGSGQGAAAAPPPGQPAPYGQPAQFGQPGPYAAPPVPGGTVPPRRGPRWGLIVLAIVVLLGLTIAAAAWAFSVAGGDGEPETDTDTTTTIDIDADTDVYDLSVGDCLNDPVDTMSDELVEVDSVESVPCDEPHEAEVYALVDLPGGDDAAFPGDDGVTQQADEVCFERFEEYVGATYEQSSLDYSYYLPTSGSWSAGDREVACLAVDYEGELLTGSVRGSGR